LNPPIRQHPRGKIMKHIQFIPLIGLALVSLACSLTSSLASPTAVPQQPTQLPTQTTAAPTQVEPTQPSAIQATRVETVSPPASTDTPAAPTSLPAVGSPTQEASSAGPLSFTETFDQANDHWSGPLIVTSQASGHDPFYKITLESGRMRFAIGDKETYIYELFKPTLESQSSISVTYEYRTLANNGVAIVCMADQAMTTWYEARLISDESKYNLYRYNQRGKEDNTNPYTLLSQGILTPKEFSSVKSNIVTFTCSNNQLKLDLNHGLKLITQTVDGSLKGNQVGIGVMSYNSLPVNIDFKTIEIQSQK
jgi:hypothetical protein